MTSTIHIRPLQPSDDRSQFRSGNIELDRFFVRYAGQNQFRHHIGTTYVAEHYVAENLTAPGTSQLLGFITVAAGEISVDQLGPQHRRLPAYPLPVLRIARLAVDSRAQGQGIGKQLLAAMLRLALEMRQQFDCVGVLVDAKADAQAFYQQLGFTPLDAHRGTLGDRPTPTPMFLPLATIEKALLR